MNVTSGHFSLRCEDNIRITVLNKRETGISVAVTWTKTRAKGSLDAGAQGKPSLNWPSPPLSRAEGRKVYFVAVFLDRLVILRVLRF